MLKLTLYKNLDTKQPITFTGRTETSILKKLRKWMDDNNGEFCPRRGQRPCQVDGLFFRMCDGDYVSMIYEEQFNEWAIVYTDGEEVEYDSDAVGEGECDIYEDWKPALHRFMELVTYDTCFEEA